MNRQCLNDFGVELDQSLINRHYVLVSVFESCGLLISAANWKKLCDNRFQSQTGDSVILNDQITGMEAVLADSFSSNMEKEL
jgi:hypothetical protein